MAIDPGPRIAPAAPVSAYSVLLGVLEDLGRRVRAAADTTEELSASPAFLPEAVARAGSPALERAAAELADAWTRECVGLAHSTRLLGDALLQAAASYRTTEWAVGQLVTRTALARVDDR